MSDINFSMYDAYAWVYDHPYTQSLNGLVDLGDATISPLAKTDWLKRMGYTGRWGQ